MMKLAPKLILIHFFCASTFPVLAADSNAEYNTEQTATSTQSIVKYLQNLGRYLGYDLTQAPTTNNAAPNNNLLNVTASQLLETYVFNTFLGALPVNAFNPELSLFIPQGLNNASALNAWANNTFNTQNFNKPSSGQQGKVSVSSAMDQQSFQPDPVNQAVLNILGTPDDSYCMNYDGSTWLGCGNIANANNGGQPLLSAATVTANIIGPLPSTYQYYTYQYNQQFLSQLNSNTLTSPLLYSTDNPSENKTSSTPASKNQNMGLTAQNQAQEAANFIRYVSGTVMPLPLPNLRSYDALYNQAHPVSENLVPPTPSLQQIQAQATLDEFFVHLRTYAAQTSVGISNLYFIMSKRLPQNQDGTEQQASSQALSEFKLATWRLFNSDMTLNNQWINQINNASPATVEKEIATLLAEMNYQMYLDRQIQERILLTNSIMLLQNTNQQKPDAKFKNPPKLGDQ